MDAWFQQMQDLFSDLDFIAFRFEPDYCNESWHAVSQECKKVFDQIVHMDNRDALRKWYAFFPSEELNPSALALKKCIEKSIGESL